MRRLSLAACLVGAAVLLSATVFRFVKSSPATDSGNDPSQKGITPNRETPLADVAGESSEQEAVPPKLPENLPPPGLSINVWGPRDFFPVIRKPRYVSAQLGDSLLAPDEPVLGLVLDNEVKAYSTNQLNEHEMVLDEIAGTPVLITY